VESVAGDREGERSPNSSITRIDGSLAVQFLAARSAKAAIWSKMRARNGSITSSRFERRLPGGQHKPAFKLAFGSYGAAARALHVSRMTIWRWCNDLSPLPRYVGETLADVIQNKVLEVHAVQNHLRDFLVLPPGPPRPLPGCCAGLHRRAKRVPVTPEDWAALG
jgi:hypothetical protein